MKKVSILILDDEEYVLRSLARTFRHKPFGVFVTTDYKEALRTLEQEEIKVVMSDQMMPDISGVEFLKIAREKHPDTERILFTGYGDIKTAEDAINEGEVYRFINKPWNDADLCVTVDAGMERYDLRMRNRELLAEISQQNKDLAEANRKLQDMYELQKEFSSNVSHELRTPLASIKAVLGVVMSGTAGDVSESQKDFISRALNSVNRLNRLVNDVLTLMGLEFGRGKLKFSEEDINDVINSVIDAQKQVAGEKNLYLKAELAEGLPAVRADIDKIQQVLFNLISNAIKFTDRGGITVSSVMDGERLKVSVRDTGCGIRKEDIARLFGKFQQVGDRAGRDSAGTGLGLAICKEIIQQHGGTIGIESKVGEGSVCSFFIPQ